MSSVRGPNDKEEEKASWLQKQGHARSIQHVMSDIAGHEIEDIVAYGAQLAIENAIFLASASVFAPDTLTVTNLVAPSPSATTLLAKFNKSLFNDISKFFIFLSLILVIFE